MVIGRFPPRQALAIAPLGPRLDRRVEIDFQRRVGQDNGADVTADHDHPPGLGNAALLVDERPPYRPMLGHLRHVDVHFGTANVPGDISPLGFDGVLSSIGSSGRSDPNRRPRGQPSEGHAVTQVQTGLERQPGQRTIQHTRVKVQIP